MIIGKVNHRPFRQGGDGQAGIDTERTWNDRAIHHHEPVMQAAICVEHAALMIDDTVARISS